MITNANLSTFSLSFEGSEFRRELKKEFSLYGIDYNYVDEVWEYKGKLYNSKMDLYIVILANESAKQLGLLDVVGLIAVLAGQPIIPTRGKLKGATKGTSVASKYISKIPGEFPKPMPTITGYPKVIGGKGLRISFTKIIGRFVGRATPIVGWAILGYDISMIFYNTQVEFNRIINGG